MADVIEPTATLPWVCPTCMDKGEFSALVMQGRVAICNQGHQFDRAKQGYFNLLLPHQKRSKAPGDDESMMLARREFLSLGVYQFLMEALVKTIQTWVNDDRAHCIDIGCGEGSYIAFIKKHFPSLEWLGVDISKAAIKKAAIENKASHFAVASGFSLPVPSDSIALALNVFAPIDAPELQRVFKQNGKLIRVSPAENHFIELKSQIYETPRLHDRPSDLQGFALLEERKITKISVLDKNTLQLLLAMTPLQWRGDTKKKKAVSMLESFEITFDFLVQVLACE